MCVQGVGADLFGDRVLFVERSSELISKCKLNPFGEGIVKARLNRPSKFHAVDPKPSDLTMGRLKHE